MVFYKEKQLFIMNPYNQYEVEYIDGLAQGKQTIYFDSEINPNRAVLCNDTLNGKENIL